MATWPEKILFVKIFNRRIGKSEIGLIVGLLIVVVYLVLIGSLPIVRDLIQKFFLSADSWGVRYGYLGAFVFTALANSTVVFPIPYTAFIVLLGSVGLNPFLLAFIAGLGAALGDATSYLVGRWGRVLLNEKTRTNFEMLRELVSRHPGRLQFFFFIMGATPIPDDVFLIPLGIMKYPIWRALWPYALGKMILAYIFAISGTALGPNLQHILAGDTGSTWTQGISLLSLVVFLYIISKTDWDAFTRRFFAHKSEPKN
jgi:membrane protein YqaA with SNARE-associated domain